MNRQQVEAIFLLAGIEVYQANVCPNMYWPNDPEYKKLSLQSPWWNVDTEMGQIVIGWRKRVIKIDWTFTNFPCEVTKDDVTKDSTTVHAWSNSKAVEYLSELGLEYKLSKKR